MSRYERIRGYLEPLLGEDASRHAKALMDLLESPDDMEGDDPLGLVAMGLELLPAPAIACQLGISSNMLKFLLHPPGPMRRQVRYAYVDGKRVHSIADAVAAIELHRPLIMRLEAERVAKEAKATKAVPATGAPTAATPAVVEQGPTVMQRRRGP